MVIFLIKFTVKGTQQAREEKSAAAEMTSANELHGIKRSNDTDVLFHFPCCC